MAFEGALRRVLEEASRTSGRRVAVWMRLFDRVSWGHRLLWS